MAMAQVQVKVSIQWWKLNTCLKIIEGLYWLGLIDEEQCYDMAENAAHNSVRIKIVKARGAGQSSEPSKT
jgi:hypothetical protein